MKEYHGSGIRALEHLPQGEVPAFLRAPATQGAWTFHHTMAEYAPTPLVRLPGLAKTLGVGEVFVKDESHRFGLNAFKGLGAATPWPAGWPRCWACPRELPCSSCSGRRSSSRCGR